MSRLRRVRGRRPGWLYRWMMAFVGLFDPWLHMSCRSFVQLASQKYERPLGVWERKRQAFHRAMCGLCRTHERYIDQLRTLAQELAIQATEDVQAELSSEATERIRAAVIEAAASTSGEGYSEK